MSLRCPGGGTGVTPVRAWSTRGREFICSSTCAFTSMSFIDRLLFSADSGGKLQYIYIDEQANDEVLAQTAIYWRLWLAAIPMNALRPSAARNL
jgi:hypothetical protein